jgi:hypothetical protein
MNAATLKVNISDGAEWRPTAITNKDKSTADGHTGSALANVTQVSLDNGHIILDEGVLAGADIISISGKESSIKYGTGNAENSGLNAGTTILFTSTDSRLNTNLGIAYSDIGYDDDKDAIVSAKANLVINDESAKGKINVVDKVTLTPDGLISLTNAYTKVSVVFEKATLKVETSKAGEALAIPDNAVINLTAKGADKDVASGAALSISGIVNVVHDTDSSEKTAKLGTATVESGGTLAVHADATADKIDVTPAGTLRVGDETNTGRLTATVDLKGLMFIDPAWVTEAGEVQQASARLS